MGFVRVAGYGQSELDAKYQEGYDDGYDDGASDVTISPVIIRAQDSTDPNNWIIMNADHEDRVNVHIINSTTHALSIIINATMSGANQQHSITYSDSTVVDLNDSSIGGMVGNIIAFPSGSDLYFYQESDGGQTNEEGSIFLTITGKRSNDDFTNYIYWTDSEDKTEGTATFTTLLS